ncbi:MAG: MgtC/SapB family protein [Turicibacter sp.]
MDIQVIIDIAIRTLLSMVIGGLIGWERESTHRPAGLRTHMLVAVGACVIMQLGAYTAQSYQGQISIDPTRLGAQVISGIGFLGAGTIMKEGSTIKGLTTAASLWAVACLGLAIGCGAYPIAIIGFISIILTLTVFDRASTFIPGGKYTRFFIKVRCAHLSETLKHINEIAETYNYQVSDIQLKVMDDKTNRIAFKLSTNKSRRSVDYTVLLENLSNYPGITTIKMTEY